MVVSIPVLYDRYALHLYTVINTMWYKTQSEQDTYCHIHSSSSHRLVCEYVRSYAVSNGAILTVMPHSTSRTTAPVSSGTGVGIDRCMV